MDISTIRRQGRPLYPDRYVHFMFSQSFYQVEFWPFVNLHIVVIFSTQILDHKAIESITPEIISLLKNRIKYTKREEVESITSEMCQLKGRNKEETEKNVYKITEEEECLPMANASKRSRSSHSLASLYKCHLCPQHYSQYRSLMRHMASKHYQQELLDMIKDGKLECFECNTSFVSVEGRLSHLLSKHKVFESIIPPREQLMIGFAH